MMNARVKMMAQVKGGNLTGEEKKRVLRYQYDHEIHWGCGGHIENRYNPFEACRCDKCGKKGWYDDMFEDSKVDFYKSAVGF